VAQSPPGSSGPEGLQPRGRNPDQTGRRILPVSGGDGLSRGAQARTTPAHRPASTNAADGVGVTGCQTGTPASGGPGGRGDWALSCAAHAQLGRHSVRVLHGGKKEMLDPT